MELLTTLAAGFIGGTVAIFLGEATKKWFLRRLQATDVARDVLIDVITMLRGVESVYDSISASSLGSAPSRADLVTYTSAWSISPPVLSCDKIIDGLDDHEAHRLALLYYDSIKRFEGANAEHEKAFFFLLDLQCLPSEPLDLSEPRIQERVDALRAQQETIQDATRDILRHGYALASALFVLADGPTVTRFDKKHVASVLREHYELDATALRLRAAYYANASVGSLYDAETRHSLVDPSASGLPERYRYAAVEWERRDKSLLSLTIDLRARVAAIPEMRVRSLRLCDTHTNQWLLQSAASLMLTPARHLDEPGTLRIRVPQFRVEDELPTVTSADAEDDDEQPPRIERKTGERGGSRSDG